MESINMIFGLLVMVILLTLKVDAATTYIPSKYGAGLYGAGKYGIGRTITITDTEGGSGGGDISGNILCKNGTIQKGDYCISLDVQELLKYMTLEQIMEWYEISPGVLEYRIFALAGHNNLSIENRIVNEGDLATEIHCYNFLDSNRNGIMEPSIEPVVSFNKRVVAKENISISNTIPFNDLPSGTYLVAGECDLLDSNAPSARAATSIVIAGRDIVNPPSQAKQNSKKVIAALFFFITTLAIILIETSKRRKNQNGGTVIKGV